RHGQPLDHVGDGQFFRARRFEEFQPRRRGIEQLAHFGAGAMLARGQKGGGTRALQPSAVHPDLGRLAALHAAGQGQPRHRADGGQRLAAETHGDNVRKIVLAIRHRQLGGGMPLDRQLQIGGSHAAAVIFHHQKIGAAAGDGNSDAGGARIHGVLHQLLHRRSRPFHHFAGSDAVNGAFGKPADRHHFSARYWRARTLPSSTPGWSNGSTFISLPMMMVSSMKCIISAPVWNSSTWVRWICRTGRPFLNRVWAVARASASTRSPILRPARYFRPSLLARDFGAARPLPLVSTAIRVNSALPGPSRNNCSWLCWSTGPSTETGVEPLPSLPRLSAQ